MLPYYKHKILYYDNFSEGEKQAEKDRAGKDRRESR